MKRLLPFLLILVCSISLAESGAYRVEVIVFRNLLAVAEATGIDELRSFSQFPELQAALPAKDLLEVPVGSIPTVLPDDLFEITERTIYMDGVWRRLRSSQGYQPLVYTAWEQNRTDYYPPMRIHDAQIIDTQLRVPGNIMVVDLTAEDPLGAYRSDFFQFDGSVQLRRSRFLHLYLDLEFREDLLLADPQTDFLGTFELSSEPGSETSINTGYGVYTLKQNRQIRTGELQYFDTPFYGALVMVTTIKIEPGVQ
jgi:hypothetical protein